MNISVSPFLKLLANSWTLLLRCLCILQQVRSIFLSLETSILLHSALLAQEKYCDVMITCIAPSLDSIHLLFPIRVTAFQLFYKHFFTFDLPPTSFQPLFILSSRAFATHSTRNATATNAKMFVGSNDSLPQDPQYQANLTELGYHLNDKGQFLSISNPAQFFAFFHTDNERANEKRKEAMHMCVRQIVKEELAKLGVKELFLTGEDGKSVEEVKPVGKHLPILVTEPVALKQKKDVIIVIGEQVQDLGIWAWRSLMKEGGIDDGSAVGLVKKLQDMRLDGKLS